MTAKLEQALEFIRLLPDEEQDRIARAIIDHLDQLERAEKEDKPA